MAKLCNVFVHYASEYNKSQLSQSNLLIQTNFFWFESVYNSIAFCIWPKQFLIFNSVKYFLRMVVDKLQILL